MIRDGKQMFERNAGPVFIPVKNVGAVKQIFGSSVMIYRSRLLNDHFLRLLFVGLRDDLADLSKCLLHPSEIWNHDMIPSGNRSESIHIGILSQRNGTADELSGFHGAVDVFGCCLKIIRGFSVGEQDQVRRHIRDSRIPIAADLGLQCLPGQLKCRPDRSIALRTDVPVRQIGRMKRSKLFQHTEIISHAHGGNIHLRIQELHVGNRFIERLE